MNLQHENERFFRRLNRSSSTSDINKNGLSAVVFKMVGMTGFEPATPSSRTKCTTKLCYIPKYKFPMGTVFFNKMARPVGIEPATF